MNIYARWTIRNCYLVVFLIILIAYYPTLDNGFISDDFIVLERTSHLPENFSYFLTIPPDTYRLSSYFVFWIFKSTFGYQSHFYYIFVLLLHGFNCFLLIRFLGLFRWSQYRACIAGILFACIQNLQEAIMWLAAMNEPIMTTGILLTLIFRKKGQTWLSFSCFLFALLSKEAAVVTLPLIYLLDLTMHGSWRIRRDLLPFILALFCYLVFWVTLVSDHSMLEAEYYSLGFHALAVFFRTLHKLFWPWIYLVILIWILKREEPPAVSLILPFCLVLTIVLIPYIFLTYQDFLPSRQLYLASIPICASLALAFDRLLPGRFVSTLVVLFCVINTSYLWLFKDPQYETRAAPTSRLVEILKTTPPQPLSLKKFPLNPWMAKLSTRLVPGWEPEMIQVNDFDSIEQLTIVWSKDSNDYKISEKGLEVPSNSAEEQQNKP